MRFFHVELPFSMKSFELCWRLFEQRQQPQPGRGACRFPAIDLHRNLHEYRGAQASDPRRSVRYRQSRNRASGYSCDSYLHPIRIADRSEWISVAPFVGTGQVALQKVVVPQQSGFFYPLITPIGFNRATRRASPALWTTSITASTSL